MRFAGSIADQSSSAAMRRLSRYDSIIDALTPAVPPPPTSPLCCCARGSLSLGGVALERPSALAPSGSADAARRPHSCTFGGCCDCDATDSAQCTRKE